VGQVAARFGPILLMPDVAVHNNLVAAPLETALTAALGKRSVVLVGMMGAGKSSIGKRLATRLGIPFVDADAEIELAAGMSIEDIFERHGEPYFRTGEARVIARLLEGGPQVLATGGGAFMNPDTRAAIATKGTSVWLKADFDVLMRRIRRRTDRPMLKTEDPATTLKLLMEARYPVYAEAAVTVESREIPHDAIVEEIIAGLRRQVELPGPAGGPVDPAGEEVKRAMTMPLRAGEPTIVHVALGARAYDIVIGRGTLAALGSRVAALKPGAKAAIVTDETVQRHHLAATEAALAGAGIASTSVAVPPGEGSKSVASFERVCDALITARIERGDFVVALGGGVVGDLAGFAAASVRRGLDFVQVPTTLLAQVDSSVGGKTGINSRHGKNLIGAFHQPILVVADTALLDTLAPREFRAGYAEMVKYGLLGDAAFFSWLEANWKEVFAGGPAREHAIAVSCRRKAAIVARDERETGERALLNLGHTFGHAFEAAAGFSDRLLHGEAVALGMATAFGFSARHGLIAATEADRAVRHLAATGLPTRFADVPGGLPSADRLMDLMAQDKKVKRGRLTFILVRAIGDAFVSGDVDAADVHAFLVGKLA
jgi:shikimate kinase / 3-dehydroquinate synthase